jgi:hypothetical protein
VPGPWSGLTFPLGVGPKRGPSLRPHGSGTWSTESDGRTATVDAYGRRVRTYGSTARVTVPAGGPPRRGGVLTCCPTRPVSRVPCPAPSALPSRAMRDGVPHHRRLRRLAAAVGRRRTASPGTIRSSGRSGGGASSAVAPSPSASRVDVAAARVGHPLPQTEADYLAARCDYERQGFVVRSLSAPPRRSPFPPLPYAADRSLACVPPPR